MEDSIHNTTEIEKERILLKQASKNYLHKTKPITIRIKNSDLLAVMKKANTFGLPYQTYINMIIHRDVMTTKGPGEL